MELLHCNPPTIDNVKTKVQDEYGTLPCMCLLEDGVLMVLHFMGFFMYILLETMQLGIVTLQTLHYNPHYIVVTKAQHGDYNAQEMDFSFHIKTKISVRRLCEALLYIVYY